MSSVCLKEKDMTDAAIHQALPLNRREFLFYVWGASIALALAGSNGAILWFAFPRFREGEFGGRFRLSIGVVPAIDSAPQDNPEGRFWLVNTNEGLLALYKVCTHLGCLYKWVPSNNRFECPCHGSKFTREGQWIEGPAPRHLDRFVVTALNTDGDILSETREGDANQDQMAGGPVILPAESVEIAIDTGERILGGQH